MAKKTIYKKSKSKGMFSNLRIPLAVVMGLVPGVYDVYYNTKYNGFTKYGTPSGGNYLNAGISVFMRNFFGYIQEDARPFYSNGSAWSTRFLGMGLYPMLMGIGMHVLANKTGINRYVRKIPFIEI